MIGVVVAAHSELADALVRTARLVVQSQVPVIAVAIEVGDSSDTYGPRLQECIGEVDEGDGVLVLTDMFGGTPSNVGMTMHQMGKVEVLTGVNLPMLIKAIQMSSRGDSLDEVAMGVKAAGLRSITVATEVLHGPRLDQPAPEEPPPHPSSADDDDRSGPQKEAGP